LTSLHHARSVRCMSISFTQIMVPAQGPCLVHASLSLLP
jgi:hypothetical protein